jgi:hypothetical protein
VKIKLNSRRQSGCLPCAAIIIGALAIAVGVIAIIIIIKLCRLIPPPHRTNEEPQLRMEFPLLKPLGITVPLPAGAIQIQRSTDLMHTNWETLSYMTLATNNGTITLTTFNGDGVPVGNFTVIPGQTNQAEIVDATPAWPNAFYRTAQ